MTLGKVPLRGLLYDSGCRLENGHCMIMEIAFERATDVCKE